jgi:hypothetical protein
VEPPGLVSLANALRFSPGVRTRELSQGPTAETFDLTGAGSGRSGLLFRGAPTALPGTSGPHSHELVLSELDGFTIVRGGAAALYGPDAAAGAVLALARQPLPDQLTSRAAAEEGVDDYQRGAFHVARRLGSSGSLFASSESRRIEGFFPGTKQVDRQFAATVSGRVLQLEGSVGFRRYDGDGRHGGFDPATVRSVLTNRDDVVLTLFRPTAPGGALLEGELVQERLETGVGGGTPLTREFFVPGARLTVDLPSWGGVRWIARAEARKFRVEREEEAVVDRFLRAAGAVRVTAGGERCARTSRRAGRLPRTRASRASGRAARSPRSRLRRGASGCRTAAPSNRTRRRRTRPPRRVRASGRVRCASGHRSSPRTSATRGESPRSRRCARASRCWREPKVTWRSAVGRSEWSRRRSRSRPPRGSGTCGCARA